MNMIKAEFQDIRKASKKLLSYKINRVIQTICTFKNNKTQKQTELLYFNIFSTLYPKIKYYHYVSK